MSSQDSDWHANMKPSFTQKHVLVYSAPGDQVEKSDQEVHPALQRVVGEHKDVRFKGLVTPQDIDTSTLAVQKKASTITSEGKFPAAIVPSDVYFVSYVDAAESDATITPYERSLWKLCAILHDRLEDSCAEFLDGVPNDQIERFEPCIRMDALGTFWAQLVSADVQNGLKRARSAEEKALLHLTQNDIVAACDVLTAAKDFKLATLIAQLPGSARGRSLMKNQIAAWRNRNDWSEFSEPVRSLYTILSGEVCTVEGKTGAPEDRASEFCISERFGLTWQQSFALRLYFGGHGDLNAVIRAYLSDLTANGERTQPRKTQQNGTTTPDTLMEILRASAGQADVARLFDPHAISGSAFNSRLAWQLAALLQSQKLCVLGREQLDALTISFAAELEAAAKLITAVWILLHLDNAAARHKAIVGILERNGGHISTPGQDDGSPFESFTNECGIPAYLIWRAKALYAKSVLRDPSLQTAWLLQAGDADEAHAVLCTVVGPQALIEQNHTMLEGVLGRFAGHTVEGWEHGGQVFCDFLLLAHATPLQQRNRDVHAAMQRLPRGLTAMEHEAERKTSLEERVAVLEMRKVLRARLREWSVDEDAQMGGTEGAKANHNAGPALLDSFQAAMGVLA